MHAAGAAYGWRMTTEGVGLTPEQLLDGHPDSLRIYSAVASMVTGIGETVIRVSRSQIAFRRRKGFAYFWRPGQYVNNDVPAVVSIALPYELVSDRFKSVVHPAPKVWMHHVEVGSVEQVDTQLRGWLAEAYDNAG